jgi:hypothetical protein
MLGEFSLTASWERPRQFGREWIPRQSSDPCALLDLAENLFCYAFGDRSGGLALRLHSIKAGEPDGTQRSDKPKLPYGTKRPQLLIPRARRQIWEAANTAAAM